MPQTYTPEFKKKIVRLHLEEGRTYKSITTEYGVSKASISKWCAEFSEECQTKAILNPESPNGTIWIIAIIRGFRRVEIPKCKEIVRIFFYTVQTALQKYRKP